MQTAVGCLEVLERFVSNTPGLRWLPHPAVRTANSELIKDTIIIPNWFIRIPRLRATVNYSSGLC